MEQTGISLTPFSEQYGKLRQKSKILLHMRLLFAHVLLSIEEAKWSLIDRIEFQQQYENMNKSSHIQL